jgi:hypothetical protein
MPFLKWRRARGLVCPLASFSPAARRAQTFKVAYSNIKSEKGPIALPGHPPSFVDTSNCTNPTLLSMCGALDPSGRNWPGSNGDPSVVALGLGEAWVCGTPQRQNHGLTC